MVSSQLPHSLSKQFFTIVLHLACSKMPVAKSAQLRSVNPVKWYVPFFVSSSSIHSIIFRQASDVDYAEVGPPTWSFNTDISVRLSDRDNIERTMFLPIFKNTQDVLKMTV